MYSGGFAVYVYPAGNRLGKNVPQRNTVLFCGFFYRVAQNVAFGKRNAAVIDQLIFFMPLSGKQNHVAGPCKPDRMPDGIDTVRNRKVGTTARQCKSSGNFRNDVLRRFRIRIV